MSDGWRLLPNVEGLGLVIPGGPETANGQGRQWGQSGGGPVGHDKCLCLLTRWVGGLKKG